MTCGFLVLLTAHMINVACEHNSIAYEGQRRPLSPLQKPAGSSEEESPPLHHAAMSPLQNYSAIAAALRRQGYEVFEPGDEMPVVIVGGELAQPASLFLPELASPDDLARSSNVVHKIWLSGDGEAVIRYFYDTDTQPDSRLFERAAHAWASQTCIRFEKKARASCKAAVDSPTFCVGNFGGCWSYVGKRNTTKTATGETKSQRISVANNCELDACIHEFGHGLGFQHQQSRPDRDHFVAVNWENFKVTSDKLWETKLRTTWKQGVLCTEDQVANLPTPYDFMSVVQYGTYAFVDYDNRPTFVARDFTSQWMLDYHRARGMGPSHYDLYLINSAYKCLDLWRKQCETNNKPAPKCSNHGFLTKGCKCRCPPGFSGQRCENSTGSIYPRLEKAQCFAKQHHPGVVDLASLKLDFTARNYANPKFNHMQFCTVIAHTREENVRPIVRLDPSELVVNRRETRTLLHNYEFVSHMMSEMYLFDCRLFFKLFWSGDGSQRMRTECFSSVFNVGATVTEQKMLSLRGRTSKVYMYFNVIYEWSQPSVEFLEAAMKLRLLVTFGELPHKLLSRGKAAPKWSGPSTPSPTDLPPTVPPDLKFQPPERTIFGVALPNFDEVRAEHPLLVFFGWFILLVGAGLMVILLVLCVYDRVQDCAAGESEDAYDDRRGWGWFDSSSDSSYSD